MESAQAPVATRYVIYSYIDNVFEHNKEEYVSGVGKDTVFKTTPQGWYITIQGSHEAIFLGTVKPVFAVGDRVKITFEKVELNAKPV